MRNPLSRVEKHEFFTSDYSIHSIGFLLFRRKQHEVFREFLDDTINNAGVSTVTLSAREIEAIIYASQKFNLDFDDAYQYGVAEKYGLTIMSFDSDFDRTEKGHKTPAQLRG